MSRIHPDEAGGVNVCAFLDAIAISEIGQALLAASDDGYDVLVGGALFHDYAHHPRIAVQTKFGWSDAAGRYQIMAAIPGRIRTDTWDWAHRAAGVSDFSPDSQDKTCIVLVKHRGALEDVIAGNIGSAFAKCAAEWASLPGANYGQHENRLTDLLTAFSNAKAQYA